MSNYDYLEATKSQLSAALDSMLDEKLSKEKVEKLYQELNANIRDNDNIFNTLNNILNIADKDVSQNIVSKLTALWLNNPMLMSTTTNTHTIIWDDVLGKIKSKGDAASLSNDYGLTLLYQICQMYVPNTDWFNINHQTIRTSLRFVTDMASRSLIDICRVAAILETLEKARSDRWSGRSNPNMVICLLKGATSFHALIEELSDGLNTLNALLIGSSNAQRTLFALNNATIASTCHGISMLLLKVQEYFKSMMLPALGWLQDQIELCM